jgi:hypothetical protein
MWILDDSIANFNLRRGSPDVMKRSLFLASLTLSVFALVLTMPLGASAATGAVTTTTYTLVGSLHQCQVSGLRCISANYANAANSTTTLGIVYAVLHNSIGQTVLFTTSTVTPAAGGNSTAYLIVEGLPSGAYNATVFAVNQNNVAISTNTIIKVTL